MTGNEQGCAPPPIIHRGRVIPAKAGTYRGRRALSAIAGTTPIAACLPTGNPNRDICPLRRLPHLP